MENKPQIFNEDQLQEAISLCIKIQNAGIATGFGTYYGHTAHYDLNFHAPVWSHGSNKTIEYGIVLEEDAREHNEDVLTKLRLILIDGFLRDKDGNKIDPEARRLEERRKQFEALKSEFEPVTA